MAGENQMTSSLSDSLHIRIISPELELQTLIVVSPEDTVWQVKQHIISTVCKDLKDGWNYGLYSPSVNNRAGKFLDEERPLKDYPLPGPIALLEFKYKRRNYKMQVNQTKLKKLHSSSSLKKFLEYVYKNDSEKVTEMTNKGLDPNFCDSSKGDTPMTVAATLQRPRAVMLALVSGGAYLDFRNLKGLTALHVAAETGNRDAIKTLLDLGASPNYKDGSGLSPLYYCVAMGNGPPQCIQMLLHDRAEINNRDDKGWTEIHYACLHGKVQHLEHLLFYGADMNAKTSLGDTALHICARYNKEECARALLFRGIDKTIRNTNNEDAATMAQLAGNAVLADIINNFRQQDVVLYAELPKYNEKRRGTISAATIRNLQRSRSNPQLDKLFAQDSNYTASLSSAGGYQLLSNAFLFSNGGIKSSTSMNQIQPTRVQQFQTPADSSTSPVQLRSDCEPMPRMMLLKKSTTGFGFVLRGAKSRPGGNDRLKFIPSPECPALQYFDSIEKGSVADCAGLLSGDFLLEVNGNDVKSASHEFTVSLIKNAGEQVVLKVVSPNLQPMGNGKVNTTSYSNESAVVVARNSPASLSPSTGSQMTTSLAGLAELERLDASLDQYEEDEAEMKSTDDGHHIPPVLPVYATVGREWMNEGRMGNHRTTVHVTHNGPELTKYAGHESQTKTLMQRQESEISRSSNIDANRSTVSGVIQLEPEPDYDDNLISDSAVESPTDAEKQSCMDDEGSSSFALMIKQATLNRERRIKERESLDVVVKDPSVSRLTSANDVATFPPPPPPPPPPAPIASIGNPQLSQQQQQRQPPSNSISRNMPPEVKKNLEENRKRDEAHAVLMAAVLKRRNMIESSDETSMADNIENKLQKSRQVQVIYRADNNKIDTNNPPNVNGPGSLRYSGYNSKEFGTFPHQRNGGNISESVVVNKSEKVPSQTFHNQTNVKSQLNGSSGLNSMNQSMIVNQLKRDQKAVTVAEFEPKVRGHLNISAMDERNFIDRFSNEDAASTISTLSTLSSLTPDNLSSAGSSPPFQSKYLSKTSPTDQRIETFPARIDLSRIPEDVVGVNIGLIPPPVEFSGGGTKATDNKEYNALPVTATLRSVTKVPPGNSMVFPARVKDGRHSGNGMRDSYREKALDTWSVSDVGDWLDSLDYGMYKENFAERNINGVKLAELEQTDLSSIGVTAVLHQIRMHRELRRLMKGPGMLLS